MENLKLTIGQIEVINGYLAEYEPAEVYDPETCYLYDTDTIIMEVTNMADFDPNELSDYLATIGYRTAFIHKDAVYGWILKKKNNIKDD